MKADLGCVWPTDATPGPYSTRIPFILFPGTLGIAWSKTTVTFGPSSAAIPERTPTVATSAQTISVRRNSPTDSEVRIRFIVMFLSVMWFGLVLLEMLGQEFIRGARQACGSVMSCDRNELKYSFFNVVNIEEKLHFTWRMTKLRNVSFKIFLDLLRKITKPQATHLIIPFNNRAAIFLRRILTDPLIDFIVSRAGDDELLELHRVQAGELPKVSA